MHGLKRNACRGSRIFIRKGKQKFNGSTSLIIRGVGGIKRRDHASIRVKSGEHKEPQGY